MRTNAHIRTSLKIKNTSLKEKKKTKVSDTDNQTKGIYEKLLTPLS